MRLCVLTIALVIAAPAAAVPPRGLSDADFAATRVQNLTDQSDGMTVSCPAVRAIVCAPVRGRGDRTFQCNFEERAGGRWRRTTTQLAWFKPGHWDFDKAGLKSCKSS